MKKTIFTGSATALVTPMREDLGVDFEALGRLIEFQISAGTDALVIAGTTGEPSTMTEAEQLDVIAESVRLTAGRVPVIAGVGGNCTDKAARLSKAAQRLGADALLHVTPYYNKTSQRGLYEHFKACAAETDLPVILYNVPARTGMTIEPETYEKLSKIGNISAIKEASGDFTKIARTMALCGDQITLYSGNDDQATAMMALGAKGLISVLGNVVPGDVHRMCRSFLDGDLEESRRLQLYYMKLIGVLFSDVSPIPVKQAMNEMGLSVGPVRLPLYPMGADAADKLNGVLREYRLLS